MTFPVMINVFGLHLHPHAVAEVLAYTGGFQLYLLTRRYFPRSQASAEQMMWIIVGATTGAFFGTPGNVPLSSPANQNRSISK